MNARISQAGWLVVVAAMIGCGSDKRFGEGIDEDPGGLSGGDGDAGSESDADADADADSDADAGGAGAGIRGMVSVELYEHDDDGARVFLSWEDAVGADGEFPFGSIFVAGFRSNDDGVETYYDQYTVTRPHVEGDYYSLNIDPAATDLANVYGALDVRSDGIIGTDEPMGIYPDDIVIERGTAAEDVNVSILVNWERWGPGGWGWAQSGAGGPSDGSGGPSDGGCDVLSVSGPVDITVPYGGGNGMVMTLDMYGHGPWRFDPFTPIATPDGAEADYQIGLCADSGDLQLVGAYDSNGNGLIDPSDLWGGYVDEPGVDGNPVTIGDEPIRDAAVEIPLNDGTSSLSIVPFARLSGTAQAGSATTFAGMAKEAGEGVVLYVAAMKYRFNREFPISSFENAYDIRVWGPDALGDGSSVDWELVVPANTIVYLWAYVDDDGDLMVNEVGEPVGTSAAADGAGGISIGDEGQTGHDLILQPADD